VLAVWAAGLLAACSPKPGAQVAPPRSVLNSGSLALERRYVIFMLERFPVVSTYLGGSRVRSGARRKRWQIAGLLGEGLKDEDVRLGEFREQFAALEPALCRGAAGSTAVLRWRRSSSSCISTRCCVTRSARSTVMWMSRPRS